MDGPSPVPKQKGIQFYVDKFYIDVMVGGGGREGERTRLVHVGKEGKEVSTVGFEDTEDLVSGDEADLGDTVGVAEDDTDLGWGEALPGELGDVLDDVIGGGLQP